MARKLAAVLAGVAFFAAFMFAMNRLAIASWPDYAAAFEVHRFTLPMMIARLCVGAIGLIAAGYIVAAIARTAPLAVIMAAVLLLLLGASVHLHEPTWSAFPLWYHLVFIGSIIPAVLLGGRLRK